MFMEPVKVSKSVTDEQEQAAPANPQSFLYFWILYTMVHVFMVPFAAFPSLQHHPSQFKAHGGFFVMMIIASLYLAVVASGILIFASFFLQKWMKDIHYTILKSIGLFSALLAPFFTNVRGIPSHGETQLDYLLDLMLAMLVVALWRKVSDTTYPTRQELTTIISKVNAKLVFVANFVIIVSELSIKVIVPATIDMIMGSGCILSPALMSPLIQVDFYWLE
ncbi:hypothetical protein Tco_0745141 [Tanacetum coccineum]